MSDLITLLANLALALSFVIGLVFGIFQVNAARRDRRERLTLEALRNFQTREFAGLIHFIISAPPPKTREEFESRPREDQISFIQFGQEMESLGILVAERFIDIGLVDKTLGSFVTTSWERYREVYLDIREKSSDPYLAEYFQWLAENIARRMEGIPREPFYKSKGL